MALDLAAELQALLASGDYDAQAGLAITLQGGTTLYLATADITFAAITYDARLRGDFPLKQSLRKITDKVEFTAQNVDSLLGLSILAATEALNNARAVFSCFYFDDAGTGYQVERCEGELSAARITETDVRLKLIDDFSAGGAVAGNRAAANKCQYTIGERGCDSPVAAGVTCSNIFDDEVQGCAAHPPAPRIVQIGATNNQASFGGMFFKDGLTGRVQIAGGRGDDDADVIGDPDGRHRLPYLMRAA